MRASSPHRFNRIIVTSMLLAACSAGGRDVATVHPLATIRLPAAYTATHVAEPGITRVPAATATSLPSPTPQGPLPPGTPLTIIHIDMFDAWSGWGFGLAAGDGASRVLRTSDGGATWLDVTPPKTPPPKEFGQDPIRPSFQPAVGFFADRVTAWVVYYEYPFGPKNLSVDRNPVVVWHTEDGGQSWSASAPLAIDTTGWVDPEPWANTFYPQRLQFLEDGLTGWLLATTQAEGMGCCDTVLFRTEDGGARWSSISAPLGAWRDFVFVDSNSGWIPIGTHGSIGPVALQTEDGGHTWTDVEALRIRSPSDHPCSEIDSGYAYCSIYDPVLFSTGGIQLVVWIRGESYLSLDPEADPSQDILAVYSSNDGGLIWRWARLPSSSEPPSGREFYFDDQSGVDVFFLNERIGWVLDYLSGSLYRTLDSGDTWDQIKQVTWNGELEFSGEIYGWAVAWGADSPTEQPYPPSPIENPQGYGLVRTFDGGSGWILLKPQIVAP